MGRQFPYLRLAPRLAGAFCLWFSVVGLHAAAVPPTITSLRPEGTNLVIQVSAPAGLRRVTLQTRSRLGQGSWVPRAVARLAGEGGSLRFELPNRGDIELIRVLADETETLPASYYTGTNEFLGTTSVSGPGILYNNGGTGAGALDGSGTPGANPTGTFPRTVTESDIWKVDGDRIYFFNALRGLQVIDIHEPDLPVLQGTLAMPASGEQMYLLPGGFVAMLVQAGCYFGMQGSKVIVADARDAVPRVAATLDVDGYIVESRLVGTALYVASQTYRDTVDQGVHTYTAGLLVTSFDLSDPLKPLARDTLWYPGSGSVVSATDRVLFVAGPSPKDWTRSVIQAIDITSPDGRMAPYVSITAAGTVRDKFKLDYQGTRFTCISEEFSTVRQVRLETFFLADPRSAGPVALRKTGELTIADRETLFATRFDGDKAYIVTFLRVDPLFVVDLSDAARPRISGELQVPGWSTYIQPLGDRLVAVGSESNRVAVSLFDVKDPARPGLLSRVLLGESYSWSESTYNEKAVSILPEAGLILVPYSGDATNGYASRVQLIDLDLARDTLRLRGVIERPMETRRAALHLDRVYTISSRELLAVDASDRDLPAVKKVVDLSWTVDQVFLAGEYLVELSSQSTWWGNETRTQLRIARPGATDHPLASMTLSNLPIAGATFRNGRVHLVQAPLPTLWWWGIPTDPAGPGTTPIDSGSPALLSVIDVRDPLAPRVEGQARIPMPSTTLGRSWQPLWLGDDLLVWYAKAAYYGGPMAMYSASSLPGLASASVYPGWGWGSQRPTLIAVDVHSLSAPEVRSAITPGNDAWIAIGDAFVDGRRILFSHLLSDVVPDPTAGANPALPQQTLLRQRDFLDVVDYADPGSPETWEPVSLPGVLRGVGPGADLLYTLSQTFDDKGNPAAGLVLTALAFDGVSAHRVDSVRLDTPWMPTVILSGPDLFVAAAGTNADGSIAQGTVATWRVGSDARLQQVGRFDLSGIPTQVVQRGRLVVVAETTGRVRLLDATQPAALKEVGAGGTGGCFWPDLSRGDGALEQGFSIPLYDYGVLEVPRNP